MAQEHLATSFSGNDNATDNSFELPKQTSWAHAPQESPLRNHNATHVKNMPGLQPIDTKSKQLSSDEELPALSFPAHGLYTATSRTCNFPATAQIQPSYSGPYVEPVTTENPATEFPLPYDHTLQPTANAYSMGDGIQTALFDVSMEIRRLQFQVYRIQQTLSHLSLPACCPYWGCLSNMSKEAHQMAQNQFPSVGTEEQCNYRGLWSSNDGPKQSTSAHAWD